MCMEPTGCADGAFLRSGVMSNYAKKSTDTHEKSDFGNKSA